ncbi:MAG: type II secretion system secretin GspD [Methylococcales bacterium]|jgi:general secretion pathway protein D|nr:type II secretion system secretin GspD [Methylococcales bacterium]
MNNFKQITKVSCLLVIGLSLGSCELMGPQTSVKRVLNPVKPDQPDVVFKQLENKPPVAEKPPELFPGNNRFVAAETTNTKRAAPTGKGSYSLNFDEADLGEVAKVVLSDILGESYVLSPKVTGKVTLQTTEPLTKEELLPTLEMVLRMNNAALVKDGRIYHIEPTADALFTSDLSARAAGYQTRVIPVKNVAVQDIADIIKPLVHDKTILNVDGKRNILIAAGSADEIARVMDMIRTFDIDLLKGRSFGLFPLAHVDPKNMIEELQSIFSEKGKGKGDDSDFFKFIPIERLNSILAVTRQAHYLEDIESWIFRLDKANTASGGGVNVYKVQHVDAKKLAATLNQIFNTSKGKDSSASVAPGEVADSISNDDSSSSGGSSSGMNNSSSGMGGNSSSSGMDSSSSSMGNSSSNMGVFNANQDEESAGDAGAFALNEIDKDAIAGLAEAGNAGISNVGKVKIIADEANNSVVIVASAQDYEVILPVIEQLDVMPLQVLIDATVVQVKLTDNLKYGISWYFNEGNSQTLVNAATAIALPAVTGGLSTFYNAGSVKALLKAEASLDNINVISSPSLMVLNNQKARINVGQQVPISTGTFSSVINTGTQSSTIQYKDTGVTLDVTPRVNANGLVIMKLKQVVSKVVSVTDPTDTQKQSPTIDKKEITSSVAVADGETIVLGGLIDDAITDTKNGIPYLYQLPVIGSLFGGTTKSDIKTELVILITPRVVKSKQDSRVISNEFKRKLTGIYQEEKLDGANNLGAQQSQFR